MTALFVVAGPVLVSRAAANDVTTCEKASGDEAIAAYTRMIRLDIINLGEVPPC
jgi:hypothetical protein